MNEVMEERKDGRKEGRKEGRREGRERERKGREMKDREEGEINILFRKRICIVVHSSTNEFLESE